jgi:hypothetical protein
MQYFQFMDLTDNSLTPLLMGVPAADDKRKRIQ